MLRDWNTGKFPRFSVPSPQGATVSADSPFAAIYAEDEKILATLPTRKERRKAEGVVKLTASVGELREVNVDAPWVAADESDSEDEESPVVHLSQKDKGKDKAKNDWVEETREVSPELEVPKTPPRRRREPSSLRSKGDTTTYLLPPSQMEPTPAGPSISRVTSYVRSAVSAPASLLNRTLDRL